MSEEPLFIKQREEAEARRRMRSTLDLEKLLKGEIDESKN